MCQAEMEICRFPFSRTRSWKSLHHLHLSSTWRMNIFVFGFLSSEFLALQFYFVFFARYCSWHMTKIVLLFVQRCKNSLRLAKLAFLSSNAIRNVNFMRTIILSENAMGERASWCIWIHRCGICSLWFFYFLGWKLKVFDAKHAGINSCTKYNPIQI